MPLSEHEQRILAEMEESLTKDDPRFAKNVQQANVYAHSSRRLTWCAIGFLGGLAILIALFPSSVVVGLIGVAIMFVSAYLAVTQVRRLGKASLHDLRRASRGLRSRHATIEDRRKSVREWLERRRRGG